MRAWSLGWPAPAKLNLLLRIVGRRPDGYHNLQTVFQFLDIHDTLDFRVREDGEIRRVNALSNVAYDDDLTVRAARLLQQATQGHLGVDIRLHKKLPMGAGLGGGSSDAATVLVALNALWDCHLEPQTLADLGLQLGADVPIFVHGYAAWAEGIGEKLQPITLTESVYLVLKPNCSVSTGEIFNDKELTRDAIPCTMRAFLEGEQSNDCLPVVRKRYPEVGKAIDWLNQYADARLTGTGACVFAEFADLAAANAVLAKRPENFDGFVAQGQNRSLLLDRAK